MSTSSYQTLKFNGDRRESFDVEKKPDRMWLLLYSDPAKEPSLPSKFTHGRNALLEDYIHDWNWSNGQFRYYGVMSDKPCWLAFEYLNN